MDEYNREQADALSMVRGHLGELPVSKIKELKAAAAPYLAFRAEVDAFLTRCFQDVCTRACYESRRSACCSHEGIITFFADVAINALTSPDAELDALQAALRAHAGKDGFKCVYLGADGCLWRVKPIVCEMFLCDRALKEAFEKHPGAEETWEALNKRKKEFTWPDRPVLFDDLEKSFIDAGRQSTLMYLHNSPGMLRVKNLAKGK
ncbi:MAG: hypothetical protein GY859_33495 [Desulfobacterales bacterium]|nr:hypothetical protein [Desulfobacterales bacterium]